jgi:hypothetical protein
MPSTASLAARRGRAYERLNKASTTLQEMYASELPRIESKAKDPELRRVEEVEQIAALLEAVAELKIEPKADSAKTNRQRKDKRND